MRLLSSEQLAAQESLNENLVAYFRIVERFAESQADVAEILLRDLERQNREQYLILTFEGDGGPIEDENDPRLTQLAQELELASQNTQRQMAVIRERLATLYEKHREFEQAMATLLEAQRALNEYIQLEQADEVVAGRILEAFGLSKQEMENAANGLADAAVDLDDAIAGALTAIGGVS